MTTLMTPVPMEEATPITIRKPTSRPIGVITSSRRARRRSIVLGSGSWVTSLSALTPLICPD
jgi:hypothetical protein